MKEVNYNKASGERIREARIAKNLTEEELAYAIDPDNYKKVTKLIKYWEKGNGFPDLNYLYKLSEIINIDVNEIYYYKENEVQKIVNKKKKGPMTVKEYDKKRHRELMWEDFENYGPAIVYMLLIAFVLVGPVKFIMGMRDLFVIIKDGILGFFINLFG